MSNPQQEQKKNAFEPQQPPVDPVRRFRIRWIVDLVFASFMFVLAVLTVKNNPTMLYFIMSAFWFVFAAWDRRRLNQAIAAQAAK